MQHDAVMPSRFARLNQALQDRLDSIAWAVMRVLMRPEMDGFEVHALFPSLIWLGVLTCFSDTFNSGSGYRQMGHIISRWTWVTIFSAHMLIGVWGIRLNDRNMRCRAMMMSVVLWIYVGRLLTTGNPSGIGYIWYVFAASAVVAYLKLRVTRNVVAPH